MSVILFSPFSSSSTQAQAQQCHHVTCHQHLQSKGVWYLLLLLLVEEYPNTIMVVHSQQLLYMFCLRHVAGFLCQLRNGPFLLVLFG